MATIEFCSNFTTHAATSLGISFRGGESLLLFFLNFKRDKKAGLAGQTRSRIYLSMLQRGEGRSREGLVVP